MGKIKNDLNMSELIEQYGLIGAIRYMEQFDGGGSGDYTKEKQERPEPTYEEKQEFRNRMLKRNMLLQEETNYAEDVPCVRETVSYTEKGLKYKTESRVDFEGMFKYMDEKNLKFEDMTEDEMKMFVKDWKD